MNTHQIESFKNRVINSKVILELVEREKINPSVFADKVTDFFVTEQRLMTLKDLHKILEEIKTNVSH